MFACLVDSEMFSWLVGWLVVRFFMFRSLDVWLIFGWSVGYLDVWMIQ